MRRREAAALVLGAVGIFVLDLGFNGSSASDLFFPPQLRKSLPPVLKNASLPPSPSPPPGLGGYLPAGQNIYLYFIGGAILAVAMLILILANRNAGAKTPQEQTEPAAVGPLACLRRRSRTIRVC